MNIQLHRKQAIMLVLAMLLAIASYWIPLPRQPVPAVESPKLSEPVGKTSIGDSVSFARESATTWRFPITAAMPGTMPGTMQQEPPIRAEDPQPSSPGMVKQLIDGGEIGNAENLRLDKSTFAPIKDREWSLR